MKKVLCFVLVLAGCDSSISVGFNGVTETRCIDGYRFVIGEGGNARQVLDQFGKSTKCQ